MQVRKMSRVEVPPRHQKEEGCVAFQLIEVTYSFYGNTLTDVLDTKILATGEQVVKDGNGFIKSGTVIP